ncbi:lasso RiPP family leader peptide-containing protein [Streptomyces sp. NPDC054842]
MSRGPAHEPDGRTGNASVTRKQGRELPGRSTCDRGPVRHLVRLVNGYTLGPRRGWYSRRTRLSRSDPFPGQLMPLTRGGPMTHEPIVVSPHEDGGCTRQAVKPGAMPSPELPAVYEPPMLVDLGHVREVTLGSSPSGSADANAQYYY